MTKVLRKYGNVLTARVSADFRAVCERAPTTRSEYLRYVVPRGRRRRMKRGGVLLDGRSMQALREARQVGHHYNQGMHALSHQVRT